MSRYRELKGRFFLMKRVSHFGGTIGGCIFDGVQKRYGRERKRIKLWSTIISESLLRGAHYKLGMITLTYDRRGTLVRASNWEANHIRAFMKTFRGRMGKRLKAYAWVAELQRNGAVHYHILVVYTGFIEYPDKSVMYRGKLRKRIWWHGSSNLQHRVRTPFYVLKYTGKEYQKEFDFFPLHARAFAVWVDGGQQALDLRYVSLARFERALVDAFGWEELRRRVVKNGVVVREGNYEGWRKTRHDLLFDSEGGVYEYVGTFATRGFAEWNLAGLVGVDRGSAQLGR